MVTYDRVMSSGRVTGESVRSDVASDRGAGNGADTTDDRTGEGIDGEVISVEELTALALAADPDPQIDDDAVPYSLGDPGAGLLPSWYMPGTLRGGSHHRTRRSVVVAGTVLAMLSVNAVGLCVTYGIPEVGDRISSFWSIV